MQVAVYNEDGVVLRTITTTLAEGDGMLVVGDGTDATHYVADPDTDPTWTERPEMTASYASDTLTAPVGAYWEVSILGGVSALANGTIGAGGTETITLPDSGTYRIDVTLFPYLPWSEEVVVA